MSLTWEAIGDQIRTMALTGLHLTYGSDPRHQQAPGVGAEDKDELQS
jgi:hypothetical protein